MQSNEVINNSCLNKNFNSESEEQKYILHRRFDRMGRLIGDSIMEKLFNTHVMIVGMGGVGSWAAESLARSGIGIITLVDFDEICITNANRQLHALQGNVGEKKVEIMAERLQKINPHIQVNRIVKFYDESTSEEILNLKPNYLLDAIDNITAKCHLIANCKQKNISIITSSGAGGKLDPLQIKLTDLSDTKDDNMAQQLRKTLRQKYNFSRKEKFDVPCVYSEEPMILPVELKYDKGRGFRCLCPQKNNEFHTCEKRNIIYGSASFVTGAFGLAMSSWVVNDVILKDSVKN